MKTERGGLILGLMVGVLVGMALALAVALYVTKAPVPFVNKVPPRTADQDAAEVERNRNWDPNAGLSNRGTRGADAASAAAPAPADPGRTPTVIAPPGSRDPAAILSGAPVAAPAATQATPAITVAKAPAALPPVVVAPPAAPAASGPGSAKTSAEALIYFIQAGAFQGSNEAEQQKAKLAMLGVETKVIEREQSGRMVFRVRAGPFSKVGDAEAVKSKLAESGVEALLVRVDPRHP
jgi:cell division protein FtsN